MATGFHFNFPGYMFRNGVDVLRACYSEGNRSLLNKISELRVALRAYQEGDVFDGETDDDGNVLWSREQLLHHEIEAAVDGIQEFRKAFAIAIYHRWERSIRRYANVKENGHRHVKEGALRTSLLVPDELWTVTLLVNTLKHNSEKWASKLKQTRADFFKHYNHSGGFYAGINLTDDHMEFLLDTVSKSGPTDKTVKRMPN